MMSPLPIQTKHIVRVLLVYACLLLAAWRYGRDIVIALMPANQWLLQQFDSHYSVMYQMLGHIDANLKYNPDLSLRVQAAVVRSIVLAGKVALAQANSWLAVTTTVGSILQMPVLILGAILSWPFKSWLEMMVRLVIGCVCLATAMSLDTPVVLWAYLWDIHVQLMQPDHFSLLLLWPKFMLSGGRIVLALVFSFLAIWAALRISTCIVSWQTKRHQA